MLDLANASGGPYYMQGGHMQGLGTGLKKLNHLRCHLLFGVTLCYNILLYVSFFLNQRWSNWLLGHYRTLAFLLGIKLHYKLFVIEMWNSE